MPPRSFCLKRTQLKWLKLKAAQFLRSKVTAIFQESGRARKLPRQRGQRAGVTKWILPNLFGDRPLSSDLLPLGYQTDGLEPNPERFVIIN